MVGVNRVVSLKLGITIYLLFFWIGKGFPIEDVAVVWPLPPEPTRVVYIESFSSPSDFKIEKSWWTKFWEYLLGQEDNSDKQLIQPTGVFVSKGKIYITDTGSPGLHIFDLKKKEYNFYYKIPYGVLKSPIGVVVDDQENIYVTDSEWARVFVFTKEGKYQFEIGLHGELARPSGIAIHPQNHDLYVVDTLSHSVKVFDSQGNQKFEFGGRGIEPGKLNFPSHITVDRKGAVYVSDTLNTRVQIFDTQGNYKFSFGQAGNMIGDFSRPKGVAVDSEGHIYVLDGMYDVVQIFTQQGELLLTFGSGGGRIGQFWLANGLYIDTDNKIYVADTYNHRVQIFQYIPEDEN